MLDWLHSEIPLGSEDSSKIPYRTFKIESVGGLGRDDRIPVLWDQTMDLTKEIFAKTKKVDFYYLKKIMPNTNVDFRFKTVSSLKILIENLTPLYHSIPLDVSYRSSCKR